MKKFLGAILAILVLAVVFTAGATFADTPLGGLAAVGLTTYAVSFVGVQPLSGFFLGIGAIRPRAAGKSNLGGLLYIDIIKKTQLDVPDGFWPIREKGPITGADAIPLKDGEKARRIYFDIGTGKGTSTSQGRYPNQTYLHGLSLRKAGIDQEGQDALDDLYNMPFIAIGADYNRERRVYGSFQAPLVIEDSDDTGDKPETEGGPGVMITANALVACDFKPRFLAAEVEYEREAEPADPAPEPPVGG